MTEDKSVKFDIATDTKSSKGAGSGGNNSDTNQGGKSKKSWSNVAANGKDKAKPGNTKKGFQGTTDGLEGKIFYYGKDMAARCMLSREAFLLYAGKTYSASEKISLKKGRITVIGIKAPKKDYTEAQLKALTPYEKEIWRLNMKRYNEAEAKVNLNLSSLYSVLWGQLTTNLRNKIKADDIYDEVEEEQDCIALLQLIEITCNSSCVISHFPSRMVDQVFDIITLSGNKMSLADYYEHFTEKIKVAQMAGVNFATPELQKWFQLHNSYDIEEEEETAEGEESRPTSLPSEDRKKVHASCNDQFFALVFMRQCGDRYAEVRRAIQNDYIKGTDHIPKTVEEAYTLFETYEIPHKNNYNNKNPSKGNKPDNSDENANPNNKGKMPAHTFGQKGDFKKV